MNKAATTMVNENTETGIVKRSDDRKHKAFASRSLSPNSHSNRKQSQQIKDRKLSPIRWITKIKGKKSGVGSSSSNSKTHQSNDKKSRRRSYDSPFSVNDPIQIVTHEEWDDEMYDQSNYEEDDGSLCTQSTAEYDPSSSRLTAVVWKRKSGFTNMIKSGYVKASERANTLGMNTKTNIQKLIKVNNSNNEITSSSSGSHGQSPNHIKIWEKRRIVLEGGILMYFHKDADMEVIDEQEISGNENGVENGFSPSHSQFNFFTKHRSLNKLKTKLIEHNIFSTSSENEQSKAILRSSINTPRGLINVVTSRASASVTHFSPCSYAPTPYSLSVIVKSETKWELCFESSREMLRWLGALTDISLKQSIESYQCDHGHSYRTNEIYDNNTHLNTPHNTSVTSNDFIGENEEGEEDSFSEEERGRNRIGDDNIQNIVEIPVPILATKNEQRYVPSVLPSNLQNSYSRMAVLNSILLAVSMMMNDAIVISSFLAAQTLMNAIVWYYFYVTYKQRVTFLDEKIHESTTKEKDFSLSIITSPNPKNLRGRSFSSDSPYLLEQQSFTEVTSEETNHLLIDESQYKPKAGDTTTKMKNIAEAVNRKDESVSWVGDAPSSIIQVRGAGYLADKKKVPSPMSLYELVAVDGFDSDVHMLDVGTRFELPEVKCDYKEALWRAPNILVISFALPTSAPTIGKSSDGKGYIVVGYYVMREETRKVLEIISNSDLDDADQERKLKDLFPDECDMQRINGIRLWEKWCRCAPTDQEMQKRLKFIPRGENLKEIGVPSWICKYNGKPMLIKRPGLTNFVYWHPDKNMMEIDVNMHPLPYLFRQAMTYLKEHYFPQIIMTFAFIIEGRDQDELPEVILGNPLQLPFVHPKSVIKSESVFNPT